MRGECRWWRGLLAVAVALGLMATGCSRERASAPSSATDAGPALFQDATAQSGLVFRHFNGATGEFYMPEIMGAGGALLDFDNDGDLDLYLVQGAMLDPAKPASAALFPLPEGHPPGNRLYRNELIPSGVLRFTDVTEEAGVGHTGYGMGVATGDFDNDGFVDLYVTNLGANVLYRNQGNGRFADVTRSAGVDEQRWSTSAAFLDYNRDGLLDLFVLNYLDFTVQGNKRCQAPTGETDYCTPKAYEPVVAALFRNEGGGRFRDVTAAAGIDRARGPGLGVTTADLNQDGWIDIYVANDGMANLLWLNQQNGSFREAGLDSGSAYAEDGVARAGMGVAAGDFDRDNDHDLFVVNLAMEGATLYRNDGDIGFLDVTKPLGLAEITYPLTGFGTDWFDYDNDGFLDLFVANGAVTRVESLRGQPYPFQQRNLLIRNQQAKRFVNVTDTAGPALALEEVTRGAAFGDVDNDGDVDILVTNNNGPARLLLNQTVERGGPRAIPIRLEGGAGRQGLGATVMVSQAGRSLLYRTMHADASYCSASAPVVYLGTGGIPAGEALQVEVRWADGSRQQESASLDARSITIRHSGYSR